MNNNCIICGNRSSFLLNKDSFDIYKCPNCSLVFVNPQPKNDFLKDKVYSYESGYQSNKAKDLSKVKITKSYKKIFDYLIKNNIKGSMLDVGCSNGEFLYHAKKIGFDVEGIELNKRTAEIAISNGIKVHTGTLDTVILNNKYDCIFLGDIIEHVPDPKSFLIKCRDLLKQDGIIIISTPNLDCLWSKSTFLLYKILKIPWSSLTPPYHLFQFSFKNLIEIAEKNDLKYSNSWYTGRPRLMYELGSLHLVKKIKNSKSIMKIFYSIYTIVSFTLYSVLYFISSLLNFIKVTKKDFAMVIVFKK